MDFAVALGNPNPDLSSAVFNARLHLRYSVVRRCVTKVTGFVSLLRFPSLYEHMWLLQTMEG